MDILTFFLISASYVYPPLSPQRENTFYGDIMAHATRKYSSGNRDTNAHETTHFINSDLRNKTAAHDNAFYIGRNTAFFFIEPNVRKRDAIPYIPNCLRFSRFNLYMVNQTEWDMEPLYVLDEWTAYVNGGLVSYEDGLNGMTYSKNSDCLMGSMELGIYSVGVCMAIAEKDPQYWRDNLEFQEFVYWQLNRTYQLYLDGKSMYPWDKQERLLYNLRNNPECERMREFLWEWFDGVILTP